MTTRSFKRKNPGYKENLLAMAPYDRDRLLGGNWKTRPEVASSLTPGFEDVWF